MKAALPSDEVARIETLHKYAILDTLEERAFDDVTMLASFICDAPIALISLIDTDRQWFKSRVGILASETPREHAFCAHAILEKQEVLVVPDATDDPRFRDNPMVIGEPGIRFYAGAPLITPDGSALGTLCVLDSEPREIPADRIAALRALARQVVAQLELRRVIAELDQSAAELREYNRRLEEYQNQLEVYQKEIKTANATLEANSFTDKLTGVKNRQMFERALNEQLMRASREKTPLSLLIVEIDWFDSFSDDFGRTAGDAALKEVARLLSEGARPYDLIARFAGNEFSLALPNVGVEGAVVVGERLRRSVEAARWPRRGLTVSVGASTTENVLDAATLLKGAEESLTVSKQRGGNRVSHVSRRY